MWVILKPLQLILQTLVAHMTAPVAHITTLVARFTAPRAHIPTPVAHIIAHVAYIPSLVAQPQWFSPSFRL